MSHQNSTPVQVYANCMCWPKNKAKENGHCQKTYQGFWKLFDKGRMFGRPFFKTNPQELSTLCIYPKQLLNKTKKVSINKTLSNISRLLPNTLSRNLWGTSHEQQWHPSSCACSTLAVSLKRWDVVAGTIKRTSQRNKGMAEKHTKSLV